MLCEQVDSYLMQLGQALARLDREAILAVIEELMRAWRERGQIFLFGNGGSAALASHMANDLCKTIVPGLPRLRAVSLTDNVPLITALANDLAYERVFAEQLHNFCQPGDVVIAVSCSGNSPNVLSGVRVAHELGAKVVALTGDTGGRLKDMADLCICAPAGPIQQQEDVHLALDHLISDALHSWIEDVARCMSRPRRALVFAAPVGSEVLAGFGASASAGDRLSSLERTLTWLRHYGVRDVTLSMHGGVVAGEEYLGDGSAFGLRLHYADDGVRAVQALTDFGKIGSLVVVSDVNSPGGETPTDLNLRSLLLFHYQNVARDAATGATIAMSRVDGCPDRSPVGLNGSGRITHLRPLGFGSAGVCVVEPHVFPHLASCAARNLEDELLAGLPAGVVLYGWTPSREVLIAGSRASEHAEAG